LLRRERRAFAGDVFRLDEAHQLQYPTLRPDIPLLIGTWGAQLAAFAGEVAAEVKVGGSTNPALVATLRERIAPGAAKAGRDPGAVGIVLGAVTFVDEDGARARSRARQEVARYLPVVAPLDPTVAIDPALLGPIDAAVAANDLAAAGALVPDDLLDRFAFSGTPAQVIAQAEAILAAGASRIEFGTPHGLTPREGLRLLGEQVLPAFVG
jgi:5,10-methylenetetrahydromethanopterin reductase